MTSRCSLHIDRATDCETSIRAQTGPYNDTPNTRATHWYIYVTSHPVVSLLSRENEMSKAGIEKEKKKNKHSALDLVPGMMGREAHFSALERASTYYTKYFID